ncbi:MAG: DUF2079 domain-containing protein [Candidatus Omnitrophica bacterium]|nr:DUF2079 domain-containing protein [Candidatus Omnitrophota bacterium]
MRSSKNQDLGLLSYDSFAKLICCLFFLAWFLIHAYRYFYFIYKDWDLAFFTQSMWQMSHGRQYASLFGTKLLANHSNFIAFLILPLFKIIPHPLTLISLKILCITLSGYILYIIAKERLSKGLSIIVMFLYFFYLPNMYGLLYEFDFESLAPLFLFLSYLYYTKNKLIPFYVCALILISIKENMPLIIIAFGIFALFQKGRNKITWGLVPIIAGLTSFYLFTSIVIPFFKGSSEHPYLSHYQALGSKTIMDIGKSFVTKPGSVAKIITQKMNINFLWNIFWPLAFLPLLKPAVLFIVLPIFLQHLLSSVLQEKMIFFYYVLSISPFLFIALVSSLELIKKRTRNWLFSIVILLLIAISAINFLKNNRRFIPRIFTTSIHTQLNHKKWEIVQRIPADKSVIATFSFLPALSSRDHLYSFHRIIRNKPHVSDNVDYALIDFNDRGFFYGLYLQPKKMSLRVRDFVQRNNFSVIDSADSVVLFGSNQKNPKKLVEIFPSKLSEETAGGGAFTLEKAYIDEELSDTRLNRFFCFFWLSHTQKISSNYQMLFVLKKNNAPIFLQRRMIGYAIYPTSCWEKGDYVKEYYNLILPPLKKGDYTLEVVIFNPSDFKKTDTALRTIQKQRVTLEHFSISN